MIRKALFHCTVLLALAGGVQTALAQGTTAFSYQGKLTDNGSPASGLYDFRFNLYDVAAATYRRTFDTNDVAVSNGLFSVTLDFGSTWFDGRQLAMLMSVRPGNSTGNYTNLLPLQPILATPYATYAAKAGSVTNGSVTAAHLAAPGAAPGQVLSYNGSSLVWQNPSAGNSWSLTGNNAASGGTFLGTINNQALELKANNTRALRLEPNSTSPNLIGGHSGNSVSAGTYGATIAGGGSAALGNAVTSAYGTVGGGVGNVVRGGSDTISGGSQNETTGSGFETIGGGYHNKAVGGASTIGGGYENQTTLWAATVGGGIRNVASGSEAVVSGGTDNTANGSHATISGGLRNSSGFQAAVGGGSDNRANGVRCTVSGGGNNLAQSYDSTVSGGYGNTANGFQSTVPGGAGNLAGGDFSFAAGRRAKAVHAGSFVWGDATDADVTSTAPNQFLIRASGGVNVQGTLTTSVLTITGGADFAEPFQLSTKDVAKGTVMVIDEENPGQLKLSDRAYDSRVAGIISGAGGVNPGITLQQQGVLEGGENVALSGRVYVQADASGHPIKPGDLLTTSDVLGHAMKALNRDLAQGAILGKAMTALESGRGLVLVLVSLQ